MTEEMAELARQAGIRFRQDVFYSGYCDGVHGDELEAFAKLVAAKEREACIKICEDFADVDSGPDGIMQDYHAHLIRARGEA
jgi:hypothetical protein